MLLTLGWLKPSPKASHLRPIASRLSDSLYAASRVAQVRGDDSDKDSPWFGLSAQLAVSAIGVAAVVRCELLAAPSYGRFAQHRLDSPLGPATGEVRETLLLDTLAGLVGSHLSRHRLSPQIGGMWPSPGRRIMPKLEEKQACSVCVLIRLQQAPEQSRAHRVQA